MANWRITGLKEPWELTFPECLPLCICHHMNFSQCFCVVEIISHNIKCPSDGAWSLHSCSRNLSSRFNSTLGSSLLDPASAAQGPYLLWCSMEPGGTPSVHLSASSDSRDTDSQSRKDTTWIPLSSHTPGLFSLTAGTHILSWAPNTWRPDLKMSSF